QHEVIKDLVAARLAAGAKIVFEAADVSVHGIDGTMPSLRFRHDGESEQLACELIAGCDGFHGVCRTAIPPTARTEFTRVYPFGWFGILTQGPPSAGELIYSHHSRGFAL